MIEPLGRSPVLVTKFCHKTVATGAKVAFMVPDLCSGEVIVDCHPAAISRPAGIHQKGERNAMLGGYLLNNDRCHTIFRARASQKVYRLKSKYG